MLVFMHEMVVNSVSFIECSLVFRESIDNVLDVSAHNVLDLVSVSSVLVVRVICRESFECCLELVSFMEELVVLLGEQLVIWEHLLHEFLQQFCFSF